jgi:hypothetical protein
MHTRIRWAVIYYCLCTCDPFIEVICGVMICCLHKSLLINLSTHSYEIVNNSVWAHVGMCGSDEKCGRHRYTFRPSCLSQKLSLFSINFVTGECTENFQLSLITAYIGVVQIHISLLIYVCMHVWYKIKIRKFPSFLVHVKKYVSR